MRNEASGRILLAIMYFLFWSSTMSLTKSAEDKDNTGINFISTKYNEVFFCVSGYL